jgi:hypothetical protein
MNLILPPLTCVMLSLATLHSVATDPAMPLQSQTGDELHAAVTDMPETHADPKTWHGLPPAAEGIFDVAELKKAALGELV